MKMAVHNNVFYHITHFEGISSVIFIYIIWIKPLYLSYIHESNRLCPATWFHLS